jgi:PBP1b-binding outer membrane lipoprotein LpoB
MKSGQVRFAVSVSEMQNQTEELKRQNQSGLYKSSSVAKSGNMQGAQYRIEGSIASIAKSTKDVKDVYYVFNLNLINNESGLLEWSDEKEIRKTVTR